MKRKFEKYEKDGWHVVELPRANLWNWNSGNDQWGNKARYEAVRTWCNDQFPKDSWEGTLHPSGVNTGISRFVFKEEKYATMFLLKWR